MRLAYLLKKFPRLSETFVLTEILSQEALGASVTVFSRRPCDDEPRHPALSRLQGLVEPFPRHSELDPWTELFGEHQPGLGPLDMQRLASVVQTLGPLVGERLPRVLPEALHLRRRAHAHGIDHVHVHFATESALVALIAHELGGPSYSITAHAKDIYRSAVSPQLLDRVVGASRFTVTVCDANVRFLRELVSPRSARRVRRLYNGILLDDFEFTTEGRAPDQILAVGRLVEKKGFDHFLRALRILRDRGRRFRATLVGDGDRASELRELAAQLGLGADVLEFSGPLAQDGVRAQLKRATVFCLPCVIGADGNRDALPTVLLEALASGVPCISTPVTGIPEILDSGACGRIVPERDPEALADELAALLDDPAARRELALSGLERARELFDARRAAQTLGGWFRETRAEVAH